MFRTTNKLEFSKSRLCVGLDPDIKRIPAEYLCHADPVISFLKDVIDATQSLVGAYKLNTAFFESLPNGFEILDKLRSEIPAHITIIYDAKRSDIGHSARAYADAFYGNLQAEAMTIVPWFGLDGIESFLVYPNTVTFIVVNSSNPGGQKIQELCRPLLIDAIEKLPKNQIGLVCPGTYPEVTRLWREAFPEQWILVPGCGTQGGDLSASVAAAKRKDDSGFLINVSRDILYPVSPEDDFKLGIYKTTKAWRDKIDGLLAN